VSSPRIDLAQVLAKAPLLADLSPNELQLLATLFPRAVDIEDSIGARQQG
jgi:hypothetical protein